jgi:hypothetical protein
LPNGFLNARAYGDHSESVQQEDDMDNIITTAPLFEELVTSLAFAEEVTTQAVGEEQPTAVSGENPSPTETSQEGGPFGAY